MIHLTISQVAKRAEVPIATIRYYERTGLIAAPPRRESGYREYPEETVKRLHFIHRTKDLGFTLHEISELLTLMQQPDGNANSIKIAAEAKLAAVEHKLSELCRMREGLQTLIAACPGSGPLHECPIVAALNQLEPEKISGIEQ
ncbi:MAG: MerR family transcriptional regulator [Nevskiaceae bacterium]|nr:MAG: MerR family transcriptional regulator [Nevskiaceae bacterium]